jgi:hypothetical protein
MFSDGLVALGLGCALLGATGVVCAQSAGSGDPVRRPLAGIGQDAHVVPTNVVVDASGSESMPQLIDSLLDAITQLSNYRKPATLPQVIRVSRAQIERTICDGPCAVKAWYLPGEGVYIDEDLHPETNLIHRSILLHELVHFMQEAGGEASALDACHRWVQREQQAYELQAQYLALTGDDSGFQQRVSAQATLVGMRTVCRSSSHPANAASGRTQPEIH